MNRNRMQAIEESVPEVPGWNDVAMIALNHDLAV
jgi:hypothetical protein